MDKNIEAFVMHVNSLNPKPKMTIYLAKKAKIALLLAKKVTISAKYSDFGNIFSKKSTKVLPKQIKINKHAIKLEKGKQPFYRLIYSLRPIKLKTLKI